MSTQGMKEKKKREKNSYFFHQSELIQEQKHKVKKNKKYILAV